MVLTEFFYIHRKISVAHKRDSEENLSKPTTKFEFLLCKRTHLINFGVVFESKLFPSVCHGLSEILDMHKLYIS